MKEEKYKNFERTLNISFRDKNLLKQAFIHRSYINENKNIGLAHNERLEFLGDAVLELVITELLFKRFPNEDEGILTAYRSALVRTEMLSSLARSFGMEELLLLSKGEMRSGEKARDYILANTFEAFIGALYLDGGFNVVKSLLQKHLLPKINEIIQKGTWKDPKSHIQEYAQERYGITPRYELINSSGPDHDKHFIVALFFGDKEISKGEGKSKQKAQQDAARNALKKEGVL